MLGTQHKTIGVAAGLATSIYLAKTSGNDFGIVITLMSGLGAMLPDIDHDKSKIGRARKTVTSVGSKGIMIGAVFAVIVLLYAVYTYSVDILKNDQRIQYLMIGLIGVCIIAFLRKTAVYQWATKHRGIMHTLIPVVVLLLLMQYSKSVVWRWTFLGLIIGYVSHLFADWLTVEGVPILWPLTRTNLRSPFKLRSSSTSCWVAAVIVSAGMIAAAVFL